MQLDPLAFSVSMFSCSLRCMLQRVLVCFVFVFRKNTALLRGGIEYAIKLQQAVVRQGTSLYKKKEIHSSGMFRYVLINDSPDLEVFTQPLALTKLVLFLSESYRAEVCCCEAHG